MLSAMNHSMCEYCRNNFTSKCPVCINNNYFTSNNNVSEFEGLQYAQNEWQKHNFPNALPHQPLLGLAEEVGELSHAHLKCEQGIRETSIKDKKDAVGDIQIYLAAYCNSNGLDLAECVRLAWEEVSKRDWVKFPKNGSTE